MLFYTLYLFLFLIIGAALRRYSRNIFLIPLLLSVSLWNADECWSAAQKIRKPQAVEFVSGFGFGKLRRKGNYHLMPFSLGFDFDIHPLIKKIGINYAGLQQFVIEPFVSYVIHPRSNAEIGSNFAIKAGIFPENRNLQPYLKGGFGLIYLTQHFYKQSTQFNFTEFIGLGAHYFLTKNTAFTIEYRFRHISNANIKRPNAGVDTHFGLCGISYFF